MVRLRDFAERANGNYLVYAREQRNALERNALAPDIQREIDALLASDTLMLVFPLYWSPHAHDTHCLAVIAGGALAVEVRGQRRVCRPQP